MQHHPGIPAALLEHLGKRVAIFNGSYRNIKITTQEDLLIAEALIKGLASI
jgi:2-C-methyl-D-erythritol 4-phosphate cytidylyltransferase